MSEAILRANPENAAIMPPDEAERMLAVKRYNILDTPPTVRLIA